MSGLQEVELKCVQKLKLTAQKCLLMRGLERGRSWGACDVIVYSAMFQEQGLKPVFDRWYLSAVSDNEDHGQARSVGGCESGWLVAANDDVIKATPSWWPLDVSAFFWMR